MTPAEAFDQAARELRRPGREAATGRLDARELIRHATLAASSHNTQPWRFRIGRDSITIEPDFSRRCPVVDPDDGHLFKSLGCAAENLVHAAAAQGFAAEVRFEPGDGVIRVLLERDAAARATALYRAIPVRQCVRAAYDGRAMDKAELGKLESAGTGAWVRTIMLTSAAEKDAVSDYVARGDFAQLTDPAFRRELAAWIRFNPVEAMRTGDGLAGRANGQPAVPTWLGRSIVGLVLRPRRQADTDAKRIGSSAGVAVFVSRRDDKAGWIETGRAYERFALQATALDVRTAFINPPVEVRELRAQFESWLGLEGEHALLMVRFGHGPRAPYSLRRPMENVILTPQPRGSA